MKIVIIANTLSLRKKCSRFLSDIDETLKNKGIQTTIKFSEYHQHPLEMVRNLDISKYDCIVSCGGDGTNFQVLNGLLKYHDWNSIPPLGIIPSGRGNSFSMDLNIYNVDDAVQAIIKQDPKPVDVCRFSQSDQNFYFVNLMGFGFITDVAKTAARFRWVGDLGYVFGVIHRSFQLRFHHIELTIDGQTIKEENCFVEFCNSRFTGGSMMMAPEARIDDGMFDVVIASPLGRFSLLKTFPKIYNGTHIDHPSIRIIKAKEATVRCSVKKKLLPDGELFGETPTTVTIIPGCINYLR